MMNRWLILSLTVLALSTTGYAEIGTCDFWDAPCGVKGDAGTCRTYCDRDEWESHSNSGDCFGEGCKCCKPIESRGSCDWGWSACGVAGDMGMCRPNCDSDERACPYHSVDCEGDDCKCCKPKVATCAITKQECGIAGDLGVCRPNCESGENACPIHSGGCGGYNQGCRCCKPEIGTCTFTEKRCGIPNNWGVCKPKCEPGERACPIHSDMCEGQGCKCCKPETEATEATIPPPTSTIVIPDTEATEATIPPPTSTIVIPDTATPDPCPNSNSKCDCKPGERTEEIWINGCKTCTCNPSGWLWG